MSKRHHPYSGNGSPLEQLERRDWIDSLEDMYRLRGGPRVSALLGDLQIHAQRYGVDLPVTSETPYVNTIPTTRQPDYPGNRQLERRIKSLIRWNAMAMVVRANKGKDEAGGNVGGHISTYASAATLYEVGFNHYFRGRNHPSGGDFIYFQGHASPGMYARAFLEGRLSEQQLKNFRQELADGGGLSSYPHPWLMPDFWSFPTVSMGLGPIMSIYHARFLEYLYDRGLKEDKKQKIWAFLGDGETDEPETLGAISLAAREHLDNLVWVINCNLQRLDGPVRGNGQIIQELESVFRGAGWNVIKVLWGSDWDELLARDTEGRLARRMGEVVDGEYQKYAVQGGAYIREHFWGKDPELAKMVRDYSDDQLWKMNLGGHDPAKVYAAYHAATNTTGMPTVILARTVKGYGLGEAGEGKNITHQQKKLNEDEMLQFRDRFNIPISDDSVGKAPFYRPSTESAEAQYLHDRRRALGGYLPSRDVADIDFQMPDKQLWAEFKEGAGDRKISTTMAFVRVLTKLLKDKHVGKQIVPIIPDEARTFGMEALFRQAGIYAHAGQLYEPVDADQLMYYKESKDGQILEEGITEAGSMSSFIAAGTAYANHGIKTIPFYSYYSMFGYQRVGDLVWAAGDSRTRGFLIGGTAGRTTLNGEGLQHEDGHSHVLFSCLPNAVCYDPAYAYEIAAILEDGMRRMYVEDEDVLYYITVHNENYEQPPMPDRDDVLEGILKGCYLFRPADNRGAKGTHAIQLLGSGSILNRVLDAQRMLEKYDVAADVWSVTSYVELRREALDLERENLLNPGGKRKQPWVTRTIGEAAGPVVAASDYMKVLPDGIEKFLNGKRLISLGTDGFGRSDLRERLRNFFEIDARWVTFAALTALAEEKKVDWKTVKQAARDLELDLDQPNPMRH